MNKKEFIALVFAVVVSQAVVLLLHSFEINALITIAGFRFYIPFCIAGVSVVLFNRHAIAASFENLTWKRPLFLSLFFVALGALIYFFPAESLWSQNDPDNVFELGLSSIFDIPLYIVWNLPQFMFLSFLLRFAKKVWQLPIVFFVLLILCSVDLYYILSVMKQFPAWSYLVLTIFLYGTVLQYKTANAIEFSVLLYMGIWLVLILFGVQNSMLVQNFFAKNFSEWDGFVKSKQQFAAFLSPGVVIIALIPILLLRRNKGMEKTKEVNQNEA